MCCFSGRVDKVAGTRIFARRTAAARQALVYQMKFASAEPTAMILPLPVRGPASEGSLRFVDLKGYGRFFADLDAGFPVLEGGSKSRAVAAASASASALAVYEVGDYEASFVPTLQDFSRLDARFRIAPEIWAQIPGYASYGFAVFKLKALEGEPHPMALDFETALGEELFFPTVHVHDGALHAEEEFDHRLYAQHAAFDEAAGEYRGPAEPSPVHGFVRSVGPVAEFAKVDRAAGLLDAGLLVHRLLLRGRLPNQDQLFGLPRPSAALKDAAPPARSQWGLWAGIGALSALGLGFVIQRRMRRAREAP